MKRLTLITVVSFLLAACAAPSESLPDLTFKHLSPISIQVTDIQIASMTNHSTEPPNTGHRFPVPPESALMQWARDRLQLAGTRNTARFTILRADATETKLKKDEKLTGLFKQQASERYDTAVEARLEIIDEHGIQRVQVTASATWNQTVREDTTLADRRRIWLELVEKLMTQFNAEMERNIQRFMTKYVL